MVNYKYIYYILLKITTREEGIRTPITINIYILNVEEEKRKIIDKGEGFMRLGVSSLVSRSMSI